MWNLLPVKRATTVPYSEPLEAYVIPDEERIIAGVRSVLKGRL
jgi:pyruvate/2-oxoglutarate/acetoin dehydrogenase E1 component